MYGTPRLLLPSSRGCIRTYIAYHSIKYIEHIPLVNTVVIRSMPFLQCFLREGLKQTISSKFIQFRHLELLRDESLPLPLLPLRRCARHAYLCPKDYANLPPEGVLQSNRLTFSAVWWRKSKNTPLQRSSHVARTLNKPPFFRVSPQAVVN